MPEIIEARIIQKVATEAEWNAITLTLYKGEIALVTDGAGKPINMKVGVGNKAFSELPYFIDYSQAAYIDYTATPTQEVAYTFVGEGTYGSITVDNGYMAVLGWDGTSWSKNAEMQLPMPTGTDILEDNQVPSGIAVKKYVSESAIDILNLDLQDVVTDSIIPEDRTNFTFSVNYTGTAYYFEGDNYNGVKELHIKSSLAGTVNVAIIKVNSPTLGEVIESKTINLSVGVNNIEIEDIGFTPSNLNIPSFVIGMSPITSNIVKYQTSSSGALKVMTISSGAITSTTQKGCLWATVHVVPDTILGTYPSIKELAESTANNENSYTNELIPEDRNGINMGSAGASTVVYGESEIFYNVNQKLVDLNIYARASGVADVFFVKINGSSATILKQTQVTAVVGKNTYSKGDLDAPDDEDANIYVFVGNNETKTPNVIMGAGGYSKTRPWYTLDKSSGSLSTSTSTQRFSFWLTVGIPVNKLVAEVSRLTNIVDNLPNIDTESIYDYTINYPILPSDIFIDTSSSSKGTPLYKNSLFQKFINNPLPSVQLVSNNKVIDIQDPSYLKDSDLGNTARLLINKQTVNNTILYKDLNIRKFDSSSKSGTLTWMSLGDSLTEGGAGFNSSPIYLLTEMLSSLGVTVCSAPLVRLLKDMKDVEDGGTGLL